MPVNERNNVSARTSLSSKTTSTRSSSNRMIRSYSGFNTSRSSISLGTTSSLPGLPSSKRTIAMTRAEKLEKWMARSFKQSTQSLTSTEESGSQIDMNVNNQRSNKLGRPTKASLLRSKTCSVPLPETNYAEKIRKQKVFAQRCQTLSATMNGSLLPNGETLHGFLIGARYNSSFTLDTNSLEKYGVHVPKRNTSMLFVNNVRKNSPSAKVFGCSLEVKSSHSKLESPPSHPMSTASEPLWRQEYSYNEQSESDSAGSIEKQLDEVFGPNEEGSSSGTTIDSDLQEQGSKVGAESEKTGISVTSVTALIEDQPAVSNLQTRKVSNSPKQRVDITEDSSCTSLVLPQKDSGEENEQDFISHEAQELTQEILKECQMSVSSFSSNNTTTHGFPAFQSDAQAQLPDRTLVDKSLQTSLDKLSIEGNVNHTAQECEINEDSTIGQLKQRPKSACPSRQRSPVSMSRSGRPHSAQTYSRGRTPSTIFVDMTSLQSIDADLEELTSIKQL